METKKPVMFHLKLPHPAVPPDFLSYLLHLDIKSGKGEIIDYDTKHYLLTRFIGGKLLLYPNIEHNRLDQLMVYHYFERFMVYQQRTVASTAPRLSPMLKLPYDFFKEFLFFMQRRFASGAICEPVVVAPANIGSINTGLSRIPTIPYPPVPPAFIPALVTRLTSRGQNVAMVERAIGKTIQRILAFYPDIQHNIFDQLKVYHYFEEVLEWYEQQANSSPSRTTASYGEFGMSFGGQKLMVTYL